MDGFCLLFHAVRNESLEALALLIEHEADLNTCNAETDTPLHMCITRSRLAGTPCIATEMGLAIIMTGKVAHDVRDKAGDTAIMKATKLLDQGACMHQRTWAQCIS